MISCTSFQPSLRADGCVIYHAANLCIVFTSSVCAALCLHSAEYDTRQCLCRLRKTVSTMEGEKSAMEKERTSLDKKRAAFEKEVATLTEKLSAAQVAASRDTAAAAARGSQAAAVISK